MPAPQPTALGGPAPHCGPPMEGIELTVSFLGRRKVERDTIVAVPGGGDESCLWAVFLSRSSRVPHRPRATLLRQGWGARGRWRAPESVRTFESVAAVERWAPSLSDHPLRCLILSRDMPRLWPTDPHSAPTGYWGSGVPSFDDPLPVIGVNVGVPSPMPDPSLHLFLRRMAAQRNRWRAHLGEQQPMRQPRRRSRRNAVASDDGAASMF